MAQDLKQFNFKIPTALFDQLEQLAKAKSVTKTDLVIQGIRQVLRLAPEKPQTSDISSDIYQQLDRLERHLQESVDYQSAVDLETNKRIKALEEIVKDLQNRLSIPDIADSIVNVPVTETPVPHHDIADNIVSSLDTKKAEDSVNVDVDGDVADCIDNSVNLGQLELVRVESDDKDLMEKSKVVDSVEMLKALRLEDPQGKWDNEHLTRYRRFKNLKDKWHKVGNIQFKYADKPKEVTKSHKAMHSWLVVQLDKD